MGKDTGLYHRNRTILRERTKRTGAPCYYCGAPFYWGRKRPHGQSRARPHAMQQGEIGPHSKSGDTPNTHRHEKMVEWKPLCSNV